MNDFLFVFASDTTLPRGDSTHIREFLKSLKETKLKFSAVTIDSLKLTKLFPKCQVFQWVVFRIYILFLFLNGSYKRIYARFFVGIFVDLFFLKLLGKKIFVEINAVISEEAIDLKKSLIHRIIYRLDEYFICNFSDHVITVTPEIKNYYSRKYKKENISYFSNGVNLKLFDPKIASPPKSFDNCSNMFKIGFVGSLSPWQDFKTLLEAMNILIHEKKLQDIKLFIVGVGAENDNINELISGLRLNDHIELVGRVAFEEVPKYISMFSVAVAPFRGSRDKNTGSSALKVFEYLAMRKPVVISAVGSMSEMIQREGVGLVYKKGDPADFAEKIFDIYSGKIDTEIMAAKGRKIVEERYSWEQITKEIVNLIEN